MSGSLNEPLNQNLGGRFYTPGLECFHVLEDCLRGLEAELDSAELARNTFQETLQILKPSISESTYRVAQLTLNYLSRA